MEFELEDGRTVRLAYVRHAVAMKAYKYVQLIMTEAKKGELPPDVDADSAIMGLTIAPFLRPVVPPAVAVGLRPEERGIAVVDYLLDDLAWVPADVYVAYRVCLDLMPKCVITEDDIKHIEATRSFGQALKI